MSTPLLLPLAQQAPAPAANPAPAPAANPAPAPAANPAPAPAANPASAPAAEATAAPVASPPTDAVSAGTTQPAGSAAPAPQGPPPSPFNPTLLIFAIGMIALMFLMGGPERKRRKELAARIAAMKTGDAVVTVGGIHGVIAQLKDSTVFVRLADNQRIEVDKSAITQVKGKPDAAAARGSDRNAKDTSAEVVEEKA